MRTRSALTAIAVLTASIVPINTAIAATPADAAKVWFPVASSTTWQTALLESVQKAPETKVDAIAVFSGMADRIDAGEDVAVPEGTGTTPAAKSAALRELVAEVKAGATVSKANKVMAEYPPSYPIRGTRGSGGTYWSQGKYVLEAQACDLHGDCVITDRLTVTLTTNVGAVTTRHRYNVLYTPSTGAFEQRHVNYFHLCYVGQSTCAQGNYPNGTNITGTGYWDVRQSSMQGSYLTNAYILWAYFVPKRYDVGARGRTDKARCPQVAGDNRCYYPA